MSRFRICRLPFLVIVLTLFVSTARAQSNEWTWVGGNSTAGSLGSYGSVGVPAASNSPGERTLPCTWADKQGNFWLFGGNGFDSVGTGGYLNDMWKYDPTGRLWTWMGGANVLQSSIAPGTYGAQGQPASGNIPPGRTSPACWTDTKGNLWLFGGFGYIPVLTYYNDLWEFNPVTNQWTWVNGNSTPNQSGVYGTLGSGAAVNAPGGRAYAASWADGQGNLWLFGGFGYDSSQAQVGLNDLWEYNTSSNKWTWQSGSSSGGQASVPGTLKTAAAGNVPGARNLASAWTDNSGNLWLFGGAGGLNDLWEFNPASHMWAWMSGNAATPTIGQTQTGSYGVLQTPNPANVPGSRLGSTAWTDRSGNLWLFGGEGPDSTGTTSLLDELWEYRPASGEWAWMGGASVVPQNCIDVADWCGIPGYYGSLGTPGLDGMPGGRYDGSGWTDSSGNFWLLGGIGFDRRGFTGGLSDLWKFTPNTGNQPIAAVPQFSPEPGIYTSWQTITITDSTPGATIAYLVNNAPPALTYNEPITINSNTTFAAIASANGYANSYITSANYAEDLPYAAPPTFSPAAGNYTTTQIVTIADSSPGTTIHYAIGSVPTASSPIYSGPITVTSSQTVEAIAIGEGYQASPVTSAAYNIQTPTTGPGEWAWMGGSSTVASTCYQGAGYVTTCGHPGWYGTLGKAAPGNVPGGRSTALGWTDQSGRFWLFGGDGMDSSGKSGLLNDRWMYDPSTALWTWMGGSDKVTCFSSAQCGVIGVYGQQGVPATGNVPGGREWATGSSDSSGHFWLFGGYGYDAAGTLGYLNDLWEFDASTNTWTWQSGSSTVSCELYCGVPGVYGAQGVPSANNFPGGRQAPSSWLDAQGNFWVYGGLGLDARGLECYPNDLWEYVTTQKQWAWQSGGNLCINIDVGYDGMYGTLGVPAPSNHPWSLVSATTFTDRKGLLWLFGGTGEDPDGVGYPLNDVWEYDPTSANWAWESAYSAGGTGTDDGVYGALGNWSPTNMPSGRLGAASWTDLNGNLWIFGGESLGTLSDFWEYQPAIQQWAWIGGSKTAVSPGSYGTLGMPAPTNVPGARTVPTTWVDKKGNLWLFGGGAYDANDGYNGQNDLWEYSLVSTPSVALPTVAATPTINPAGGTFTGAQNVTLSDSTTGAVIYYTTDGSTPNGTSAVYAGPITVSSSLTVQAVAVASGYANSPAAAAAFKINLPPPPPPPADFSLSASATSLIVPTAQSGTISVTVAPLNGFKGDVSLSCSGAPAGSTCTLLPQSVTPSGTPVVVTLTIAAPSSSTTTATLLPLTLGCLIFVRRRRWTGMLVLVLCFCCGCGGGGSNSTPPPSPPQPTTSTVQVTGTSGSLSHSVSISVTVN